MPIEFEVGMLTVYTPKGKVQIACTLKDARNKADGNGYWECNGQKIYL